MNPCKIDIQNFSVKRGTFTLKPLSLSIRQGEIFAILGRTGSGKTILLESIAGMYPGNQGTILLDGTDVTQIPPANRSIGFLYQDHLLFPHMKVRENISYGLKMHGYSKKQQKERTEKLMEMLSITQIKDQYPGTLSGGESQRTALARALALNPDVLLLDEPFSALDPAMRQTLYKELLKIYHKYKCTIIFVTHDFSEARQLAHRIGILLDGELRAVVDGKDLMTHNFDSEVEQFLGRK
ncbi:MAG: ATP-binding cassette domain-containing protein [Lachnospiraceae bacterium]|nr:ATP-binding cassette domain-containing protein [Lachnospiraceae bacterium]